MPEISRFLGIVIYMNWLDNLMIFVPLWFCIIEIGITCLIFIHIDKHGADTDKRL